MYREGHIWWRWWRTGKLGVLQSMGSQRAGKDWATEQQQKRIYIHHSIIKCPTWLFLSSIWYKAVKFWVKQRRSRTRRWVRPHCVHDPPSQNLTETIPQDSIHGLPVPRTRRTNRNWEKTQPTEMTGHVCLKTGSLAHRLWKHNLFVNLRLVYTALLILKLTGKVIRERAWEEIKQKAKYAFIMLKVTEKYPPMTSNCSSIKMKW